MVLVFLANGFEDTEAICTIDVLRRAKLEVLTVSITESEKVTSSHNITVVADRTAKTLGKVEEKVEMIVLPGGGIGTKNLFASDFVRSWIKWADENGKYIGAICAAPTVLGRLGYLKDKEAVCYPGMEEDLHCKKLGKYVVADGKVITGAGMGVTVEFALRLVEALSGKESAESIKKAIVTR